MGLSSAGAAPAIHSTEPAAGEVLDCGDTTYTVVSGEIAIVLHEGTSASGNTNFTGKFQVVSRGGGTVDSVNVVEHISFNGKEFSFDFGTCVAP